MKRLLLMGLLLSSCAHETTTMDRELALKLVDSKNEVKVIQAAPPVFNVNFNNQGGGMNSGAGEMVRSSDDEQVAIEDTRTNCINSPVYSMRGTLLKYVRSCVGGQ